MRGSNVKEGLEQPVHYPEGGERRWVAAGPRRTPRERARESFDRSFSRALSAVERGQRSKIKLQTTHGQRRRDNN